MAAESGLYAFGPYILDRTRRLLLREGTAVALTPKAFDLLSLLVEQDGVVVSKESLMERLWPDTTVDENNLTFQISTLRKALGDGRYVVTIPGRGYQFTGSAQRLRPQTEAPASETSIEDEQRTIVTVSNERTSRPWLAFAAVLLAIALVAAAGLLRIRKPAEPAAVGIRSIAVLPFRPIVATQRNESLELGMADTLITRLSHIPSIVIRPTSAIRRYSALDQDPVAAGRELGVDSVLDGSIHRSADRMRVTVRLLRTADGQPLWASQFDETAGDLLAVQDRVADGVARSIVPSLSGREQKLLSKRSTDDLQAYDFYLKGAYSKNRNDPDRAIEYFERAIERDPGFAAAWAGAADTWLLLARFSNAPPHDRIEKARAAAQKAIELDPELADGHASLASIYSDYDWRWDDAEREFRRALDLNPNYAEAHTWYAALALYRRNFDVALEHSRRALELDPLSPGSNLTRGTCLSFSGHPDEAIRQLQETLRLHPNFPPAMLHLGFAYMHAGRVQDSLEQFRSSVLHTKGNTQHRALYAWAAAKAGQREEALKIVREIEKVSTPEAVASVNLALAWTALGDHDRAFHWLERAYRDHIYLLRVITVIEGYAPLRNDPRYTSLLRRMRL